MAGRGGVRIKKKDVTEGAQTPNSGDGGKRGEKKEN